MKSMKKIGLASLFIIMSACSMQQDPLAGASDAVKKGVPPEGSQQSGETAISKEALQIDSPTLVNGRVGTLSEIKIQGRVLIPGVGFTLQIENMANFPGATFDAATGIFKWTPSQEVLANSTSAQFDLIVQLITAPGLTAYPVTIERKAITLNIFGSYMKPIITSVQPLPFYSVGNKYGIAIQIEDTDAASGKDLSLVFKDCASSAANISSVLSYSPSDFTKGSDGKFSGTLSLNLSGGPFAYNNKNYCFNVINFSKYGVASEPYKVDLIIKNPLNSPRVTRTVIDVKKGTTSEHNFSFYDPSEVGSVRVSGMPDLTGLPGSSIKCTTANSVADCKLIVDGTAAALGMYNLNFRVQNSLYPQDMVETTSTVIVSVKDIL